MAVNYTNGGWFKNPATGRVQQYWNGSWYDQPVTGTVAGRNYEQNPIGTLPGDPGYSGGASSNPLQQINDVIQNSFQKLQNEVTKKFGEYKSGKPFRVDEVLAEKTKAAAEQIDPYYNQILGDYLLGVQRKIDRGINDTRDLLGELSASTQSYTGNAQMQLDQAVEQAGQGFADTGLFGSGAQMRAEGQLKQATGANLDDYMRTANLQTKQANLNLSRGLEDIGADKKTQVSELERNRFTDVQQRAGQLTKEAGQQYIQGFQGVLPPELQSASGFDMFKSLGIYS